jgi:hypothetical protein
MSACILCTLLLQILVTSDGECIEIRTRDAVYPCTAEVMQDSGCWDEDGHTLLCGASWIEVVP